MLPSLRPHCRNCRTDQVAGPRPPKSGFGPLSPEYRLSIYSLYVDGALWAPGAPQGFLEVPGPVWAAWAAWGCLGLSWALLGVLLGLPGQPLWLPGALGPDLAFGCLTYLLLVACCLSFGWRFDNGFLAFGRWQVGPLVVGRVGGWVRWLLVGLGVGSLA